MESAGKHVSLRECRYLAAVAAAYICIASLYYLALRSLSQARLSKLHT